MTSKRFMSLSLDLDNKWSYLRTYGDSSWEQFPSYLSLVCPRILEFFAERDIRITFYIVGKDASIVENQDAIASLSTAGHEIGNHSYMHEPWLHLYSEQELHNDLELAEQSIEQVTGVKVDGFRGPGYSLTETTLRVLQDRRYRYDATAFPNILNPLSRAYLFATSDLSKEEKKKRKALFGTFSDAFRPVKPYQWSLGESTLLELPVTTMPVFKTPIHFSYLLYLGQFSRTLAMLYLKMAAMMCRMTGTEPSLLLHPLDFMGAEDGSDLAGFPGMRMAVDRKLELLGSFIDKLANDFTPVTMGEHIDRIAAGKPLKSYAPTFSTSSA